jgi:hypothetical protein
MPLGFLLSGYCTPRPERQGLSGSSTIPLCPWAHWRLTPSYWISNSTWNLCVYVLVHLWLQWLLQVQGLVVGTEVGESAYRGSGPLPACPCPLAESKPTCTWHCASVSKQRLGWNSTLKWIVVPFTWWPKTQMKFFLLSCNNNEKGELGDAIHQYCVCDWTVKPRPAL